jgi:hypothetical protein
MFSRKDQQAPCQCKKLNEIRLGHAFPGPGTPAIRAGRGRKFHPQELAAPALPGW